VIAVAVAVFAVFQAILPAAWKINESADYLTFYEPVAKNLLDGQGLTLNGEIATRYPPGYPLLTAMVLKSASWLGVSVSTMASCVSALCFVLAAVILFDSVRVAGCPERAMLVSLLWVMYPPALWLTKQPNSEQPFIVLLFAGVRCFLETLRCRQGSGIWAMAAGTAVGLASLVRPITIGLGCVMAFVLICTPLCRRVSGSERNDWIKSAGLLLLGNLLAVLPWETWVWQHTQRIIPLSTLGMPALYEGVTYGLNRDGTRNAIPVPTDVVPIMDAMHQSVEAGAMTSFTQFADFSQRHWSDKPGSMAKLYAIKALRAWHGTDSGRLEGITAVIQFIWIGMIGVMVFRVRGQTAMLPGARLFAVLSTLYFWGLVTATFSIARYMTPAMGILLLVLCTTPNRPMRAGEARES